MPEKKVLSRIALVALVLAMGLMTMRCESQEPAPEAEARTEAAFELLRLERFPAVVNLIVNRPQGTIRAVQPFVELCRDEAVCPEDQFEWRIPGGLQTGERLVIAGAREQCFAWSELEVTPPSNVARSGPYNESCEAPDKYGHYWPYLVTLYDGEGEVIARTDPGGIFRRGG